MRTLYLHSAVGMAVCDLAGRYVSVNAALCGFLGYTSEELLARTYMDVTHPDDVARNVELRAALIESRDETFQVEKRYLHKSGAVVWALTVVSMVRDAAGQPLYTIGQMLDISPLKQTEQALRLSQSHLASAQKLAHIGDWAWNIASGELRWSDEVYRIFGLEREACDVNYGLFVDHLHPDDRAAVMGAIDKALAGAGDYDIDHRICLDDGRIKVVHEIGFVFRGADGLPKSMIGTVQDITERYQYEQTVLDYRKQIQRLAAHDNLLIEAERKRIAHEIHDEIGQLLTVLKIDMQLCRAAIPYDAPLHRRTEDMLKLIEQTIASVRDITHNLRPPALNLGLAAALEWLVQDVGRRTALRIVLNCDYREHIIDDDTATAAFRAVQESVTNIIRHASATDVLITLACRDENLVLEIADNGCGFDVDAAFRRGGFGLLGMRERIAALGGRLDIESDVEAGTTVRIALAVKR